MYISYQVYNWNCTAPPRKFRISPHRDTPLCHNVVVSSSHGWSLQGRASPHQYPIFHQFYPLKCFDRVPFYAIFWWLVNWWLINTYSYFDIFWHILRIYHSYPLVNHPVLNHPWVYDPLPGDSKWPLYGGDHPICRRCPGPVEQFDLWRQIRRLGEGPTGVAGWPGLRAPRVARWLRGVSVLGMGGTNH